MVDDKSEILRRRAQLVASMLASLGSACSAPEGPADVPSEPRASCEPPAFCPCLQPPMPSQRAPYPGACVDDPGKLREGAVQVCRLLSSTDPDCPEKQLAAQYRVGALPLPCADAEREKVRGLVCDPTSEVTAAAAIEGFCARAAPR